MAILFPPRVLTLALGFLLLSTTASAAINGLTIVDASTGKDFAPLISGNYPRADLPAKLSIRCEVSDVENTASIKFFVNDKAIRTERREPFAIAGDGGRRYNPYDLPLGSVTLRVVQSVKKGKDDSRSVTLKVTGKASSTTSVLVEAEDFSRVEGGIRTGTNTDGEGGKHLNFITSGSLVEYFPTLPVDAQYNVQFRVASKNGGGKIALYYDLEKLIGEVEVKSTGGWTVWKTVSLCGTFLSGNFGFRLVFEGDGMSKYLLDLNWINFEVIKEVSIDRETVSIPIPCT